MHPVNPFLRAFFRSALPSQCLPINNHVLLVPTTDCLLHGKDRETGSKYADLAGTEEFLASHVLRISASGAKETNNVRESKGKAKQYSTINGRTVVVKDSFVYSNKGFKSLNQAQLLNDIIHYPYTPDNQQWLVYYISRPLIGSFEAVDIVPATIKTKEEREAGQAKHQQPAGSSSSAQQDGTHSVKKKEISTFGDLLNDFPMVGRHMQDGLDQIFKEFGEQFGKPVKKQLSRASSFSSHHSAASLEESLASLKSSMSGSGTLRPPLHALEPEEDALRTALEQAVTAAIDIFQTVDQHQLSTIGSTTNLSGSAVERLIERYVTENLHERILFPRISSIRRVDDVDLESRIKKMTDIDIAQVGIVIEGGRQEKRDLSRRLDQGVAVFKKLGVASSPLEMIETLVSTQKAMTGDTSASNKSKSDNEAEKKALVMTMNADTLVSMLLVVVIRSSVRHLNARLSYMRNFIFMDDIESGEAGYALSTFEAVLSYLANESDPLRRASKTNSQLWQATREGNLVKVRSLLEPGKDWEDQDGMEEEDRSAERHAFFGDDAPGNDSAIAEPDEIVDSVERSEASRMSMGTFPAIDGSLTHVFPFQKPPTPPPEQFETPKRKRVSMAPLSRSSMSSGYSSRSDSHTRQQSMDSTLSQSLEAESSVEKLAQSQGVNGESVLMMAIESGQEGSLKYLLSLADVFSTESVLEDTDNEDTTLLSAAVQTEDAALTETLLDYIQNKVSTKEKVREYLAKQDSKGRSVAHYLFHQPRLLDRVGPLLSWRLRDKNGQTPLFALCRSYDHSDYHGMVSKAMWLAQQAQDDGELLHLDDHIDGKGNTLLHIVHDPFIAKRLLQECDTDVNAANGKRFTPLMVASKYGKMELVRTIFTDSRVDLHRRDLRGLTAIELAKDDEIRNRIDDMVLLTTPPQADGRITTVVRSFFVEDASVRLILKSGAPNDNKTVTVTTSRRSLQDFENLAKWLALEQPASWLPTNFNLPSPFMIPSKPSRALLRDTQLRLDNFLNSLLTHATFSTHEMVWEFFLVPDLDALMLAERSIRKAEVRAENVREEYDPVLDTTEVELFVEHASDQVRKLCLATKSLVRRVNTQRLLWSDYSDLATFSSSALSTLTFLPQAHKSAFDKYTKTLLVTDTSPLNSLYYALHSMVSTSTALSVALHRPSNLIGSMESARRAIDRQLGSLSRQSRWTPSIGFFDDTRRALADEAEQKTQKAKRELETLGSELRYTQTTIANELAGWQEEHVRAGRAMLRNFAMRTVVREKDRLEAMKRAVRVLRA